MFAFVCILVLGVNHGRQMDMVRVFIGGIPVEYQRHDVKALLEIQGVRTVRELVILWPQDKRFDSACASMMVSKGDVEQVQRVFQGMKVQGRSSVMRVSVAWKKGPHKEATLRMRRDESDDEVDEYGDGAYEEHTAYSGQCETTMYFKVYRDVTGQLDAPMMRKVLRGFGTPVKILIETRKKQNDGGNGYTQGWAVMSTRASAERCIAELSGTCFAGDLFIELELSDRCSSTITVACNTNYAWDLYQVTTSPVLLLAGLATQKDATGKPLLAVEDLEVLIGAFGDVDKIKFLKERKAALVELRTLDDAKNVTKKLHQLPVFGQRVTVSSSPKNTLAPSRSDDPFYREFGAEHHRFRISPAPKNYYASNCLKVENLPEDLPLGDNHELLGIYSVYGATSVLVARGTFRLYAIIDFPDISSSIAALLATHNQLFTVSSMQTKLHVSFSQVPTTASAPLLLHNAESDSDSEEMAI